MNDLPDPSQEPSSLRLQKVANFGTSEPWVARIQIGIPELTMVAFSDPASHQAFKDDWHRAGMKLGEAFSVLVELRAITADPGTPTLELSRAYSSFYGLLWAAYKDRWQTAMRHVGFDMSFLFVSPARFEARLSDFAGAHSNLPIDRLKQMAASDRASWQDKLSAYRNEEIEHRSGTQNPEEFEQPTAAEAAFHNVWHTMEEWAIQAIDEFVKPPLHVYVVSPEERDTSLPLKYKLGFDTSAMPPLPGGNA